MRLQFQKVGTQVRLGSIFSETFFKHVHKLREEQAVLLYKGARALIRGLIEGWLVLFAAVKCSPSSTVLFGDLLHNLADAAKAKNCKFLPHIFKGEIGSLLHVIQTKLPSK